MANTGHLDFATLTPINSEAVANFESVSDIIRKQPSSYTHHSLFLRFGLPVVDSENDFSTTLEQPSCSSDATTEIDSCDGVNKAAEGCYVLSLTEDHLPFSPKFGWAVGKGRWEKDPDIAEVDLLLAAEPHVYPRHLAIRFDGLGRIVLQARHNATELDGQPLTKGSSRLLAHTNFIKIGPLLYRFAHILPRQLETAFRDAKTDFLKQFVNPQQAPHELTSATPSANDVKIGDWVIHGIAGVTSSSVVDAASNIRTLETVAVKSLRRSDHRSVEKTNKEIAIYEALNCLNKHEHGQFVMSMHSVLYRHGEVWPGFSEELFLLWSPLAHGTFQRFSSGGIWSDKAYGEKLQFFCQVCLGLQAVHEAGWIHRDIKPQNLYVVNLSPPRAVVGDFGDAAKLCEPGLTAEPGHHGTIGFLAPELENPLFARKYTQAVDVWSMGAVGCFLFIDSLMPWDSRQASNNIYRFMDRATNPILLKCQAALSDLARNGDKSIQGLLYQVLQCWPHRRADLRGVLVHPALRDSFDSIGVSSVERSCTGKKHSVN